MYVDMFYILKVRRVIDIAKFYGGRGGKNVRYARACTNVRRPRVKAGITPRVQTGITPRVH